MSTQLNPYLNFDGQAAEAMDFYASVFGGTVERMLFKEMPDMPGYDESMAELVMHSALSADSAVPLMASDVPPSVGEASPHGAISLSGDEEETLQRWWAALSDGGEVTMPLEKAPWGDSFGAVTDKYGVSWLVNISGS